MPVEVPGFESYCIRTWSGKGRAGSNLSLCYTMQDVWPALASAQWSPLSRRVVEALSAKAQAQGLALLSRAYSTISAAQAAAYLGVPAAQLAEGTVNLPWLTMQPL